MDFWNPYLLHHVVFVVWPVKQVRRVGTVGDFKEDIRYKLRKSSQVWNNNRKHGTVLDQSGKTCLNQLLRQERNWIVILTNLIFIPKFSRIQTLTQSRWLAQATTNQLCRMPFSHLTRLKLPTSTNWPTPTNMSQPQHSAFEHFWEAWKVFVLGIHVVHSPSQTCWNITGLKYDFYCSTELGSTWSLTTFTSYDWMSYYLCLYIVLLTFIEWELIFKDLCLLWE